jgi:hypothetical protein
MILVISSIADGHAREVLAALAKKGGAATLLDLACFPVQFKLTVGFEAEGGPAVRFDLPEQSLDLAGRHVVWWRRPQPLGLHAELRGQQHQQFALSEAHSALSGLWQLLDAYWINQPTRDEVASCKLYQLQVAREIGLRIPHTCVTNDPDVAARFIARRGAEHTVCKAFSGTEQAWRETRLVGQRELEVLDHVRFAPVIFQEYIPADADLRITVVGDQLFSAAIYSQETEYPVDFRMAMDQARIEAFALPPLVTVQLHALMARLGLVYGAIDMRRTPQGDYVFLETNSAGQWLFIEQRTAQPITEALATLMFEQDRHVEQPRQRAKQPRLARGSLQPQVSTVVS